MRGCVRDFDAFENRVVLLGHLEGKALACFYAACDVLALPSINPMESFGIVQVESMLCGTPSLLLTSPAVVKRCASLAWAVLCRLVMALCWRVSTFSAGRSHPACKVPRRDNPSFQLRAYRRLARGALSHEPDRPR